MDIFDFLKLNFLHKIYGDTTSLQSINFLLDTNELVAIVYLSNFPLILIFAQVQIC